MDDDPDLAGVAGTKTLAKLANRIAKGDPNLGGGADVPVVVA